MENMDLKYVELIFDKQQPQPIKTEINITGKVEDGIDNLEYKFIVGRGGIWKTIRDFSPDNNCVWVPDAEGNYIVMIQAREINGKKPLDYLAKQDFEILKERKLMKESTIEEIKIGFKDSDIEIKEAASLDIKERQAILGEAKEEVALDRSSFEVDKENVVKNKLIQNIKIDKDNIVIGEKCTIEVETDSKDEVLYRFFIKRYKDWDIIRDYDTDNILKYTATQIGEKEFLIQCKKIESNAVVDDYRTIKIKVNEMEKLTIENFKCENKEILAGEQLRFNVQTNYSNESVLYKFYKIYENGKSKCIQEYSNKNILCYDEEESGDYRILCLVKNILSPNEYDDRALIVYKVQPYKKIQIKNFIADLSSPQALGSIVKFSSEVEGGKKLLYRYIVKGVIEEDTGFIDKNEYKWTPKEIGNYEITMQVKDASFAGEYEDVKRLNFLVEKKGEKPLKIADIIVDKGRNILINTPVNIMVKCESEAHVEYAFIIRYEDKIINKSAYNKSNWIDFIPTKSGEYEVEIMAKDKYSKNEYDVHNFVYLKVVEYIPARIDYIIMPLKETHLVGDMITFECIVQDTDNILMKYEIKINGRLIEETDFIKDKKLKFLPKASGKYTIDVYAKHVKCSDEFDFKKQINFYVSEALPVINTKIVTTKNEFKVNEEADFEVVNKGGKDTCYEFYLMDNNVWEKVQSYSRKKYYNFIPFKSGKYKLLVLVKSYYKKVNYEDYDVLEFEVKDL